MSVPTFDIEASQATLIGMRSQDTNVKTCADQDYQLRNKPTAEQAVDVESVLTDPAENDVNKQYPTEKVAPELSVGEVALWYPCWAALHVYVHKFKGNLDKRLPIPKPFELFWSWLGAFLGIFAISGLNQLLFDKINTTLLIPSFGASAVLLFGVIESKLSQPRNVVGGHIISAVVGLSIRMGLGEVLWLSAPLGMSLALLAMQITATTHPPGGATALIAASMSTLPPGHGWMFLAAVAIDTVVMQTLALIMANMSPYRHYPTYWW